MESTDALVPGSPLEEHLRGIESHKPIKHSKERQGLTAKEFRQRVRGDILGADRAVTLDQPNGRNLLFGNTKTGGVGFINATSRSGSTYFTPDAGAHRYINDKVKAARLKGQNPTVVDLASVRKGARARTASPNQRPTSTPALPLSQPGTKSAAPSNTVSSSPKTNAPAPRPVTPPKTAAPAPPPPRPAAPRPPGPGRPGGAGPGGPR